MHLFHSRPGPRRALIVPVAIGVSLMVSACATDPYVGSVPMTAADEARETETPNSGAAAALKRVAIATRAAGDYASAINVLKRAHKLAPQDTMILLELGESLAAVGAYNEAREIMAKALAAAPHETRALRGLGCGTARNPRAARPWLRHRTKPARCAALPMPCWPWPSLHWHW